MLESRVLSGMRILITGGSGWLGQETLCLLAKLQESRLHFSISILTGSGAIFDVHGKEHSPQKFAEASLDEDFDLIIHLAFILPSRIELLSQENYIALNREITSRMASVLRRNPNALKLLVSSGASTLKHGQSVNPNVVLYGELKRDMEERLFDENTLILRIWSITGHHIPPHSKYALTDFLINATSNREIIIENNILRSYVAAQDIIGASLAYLINGGRGIVNSGGDKIALSSLAFSVVKVLKSRSSIHILNSNFDTELNYVSPPCEIPNKFTSSFSTLNEQVEDLKFSFIGS